MIVMMVRGCPGLAVLVAVTMAVGTAACASRGAVPRPFPGAPTPPDARTRPPTEVTPERSPIAAEVVATALALKGTFTDVGARPRVSSTKGLTGHPLSMAGVMEAAFCALALRDGFIPGNVNLLTPDAACEGLDLPRASIDAQPKVILNNTSGFGGSNVCHILRRHESV